MAKRLTFEDLPPGACFAYDPSARAATRRKVDERHTVVLPGGRRAFRVDDVEFHVVPKPCPTGLGRRHSRRNLKSW